MNKKFVYQVANKKSYTMMQGQPNIKSRKVSTESLILFLQFVLLGVLGTLFIL